MTDLNILDLILHRGSGDGFCMHSLHADTYHVTSALAKALSAAKGSRDTPLSLLPTPNPFAPSLTSQPRCGDGPVRSSANRREPVLGATSPPPPPSSYFFLPYVHTHTHIRISVLMRACYCLCLLCS